MDNQGICDNDDDDILVSIMARVARVDSEDEFPEVADLLPSKRGSSRKDVNKGGVAAASISRQPVGKDGRKGKENEPMSAKSEDIQNEGAGNLAQKPKPRKRILKHTTNNPLLRPLTTTTTASSKEVSVRKTGATTVLIEEEKNIMVKTKKIQSFELRTRNMKSERERMVEESESDGMSDFVVSDDDSATSIVESSDEGSEVEEVVKTPPRSVRRLVRGRRPVREETPEDEVEKGLREDTDEEESEGDDLAARIKKLSMGPRIGEEGRSKGASKEVSSETSSERPRTKKEPTRTKKSQASSREFDNPISSHFLPEPTKSQKDKLPRKKSQPPNSDIEDAFTHRFSPPATKSKSPIKKPEFTTPPSSPDLKPRKILSPTKTIPQIPDSPHKPDSNEFWDADVINDWNNEYSPQKPLPKSTLFPGKLLFSPSKSKISPVKPDRAAKAAKKAFEESKTELAETFLKELDTTITNGQIAALAASTGGIKVIWSNKLNTTAGRANWKRETLKSSSSAIPTYRHHAAIELASKVIDNEDRLLNVVAHEFCHLANFMISNIKTNPHGKEFKVWARKVSTAFKERGVEVTTKHTYEIEFKYIWECEGCKLVYQRHSKSIDPVKHRCGKCKGVLEQVKPVPRISKVEGDGKARANPYQSFVKENLGKIREENPGSPLKVVMGIVGERYRESKNVEEEGKKKVGGGGGASDGNGVTDRGLEGVVRKLDFLDLTSP